MQEDFTTSTLLHIKKVNSLLTIVASELLERARVHDDSKFLEPERTMLERGFKSLAAMTYGSPEYFEHIELIKPAIEHHYSVNRHHPQFHTEGVNGMNLIDIVEMFVDWYAAVSKHDNGDIFESIKINQDRFNISPQLSEIFVNTAKVFKDKSL